MVREISDRGPGARLLSHNQWPEDYKAKGVLSTTFISHKYYLYYSHCRVRCSLYFCIDFPIYSALRRRMFFFLIGLIYLLPQA